MGNFDALPTWAYATPHNIQLQTPQNESCDACHGNPDIFLTADKVSESELSANQQVIVSRVPAPVEAIIGSASPQPEDHINYTTAVCISCHTAGGDIPTIPDSHSEYAEGSCENCHEKP